MSASRCKCSPRRPTYAALTIDFHGISRSTVKFQLQASGFLKVLLCEVTVRGRLLAKVPPGLSTKPNETLAVGGTGGFPPKKIESLTPRRVKNRPAPARITVFGVIS